MRNVGCIDVDLIPLLSQIMCENALTAQNEWKYNQFSGTINQSLLRHEKEFFLNVCVCVCEHSRALCMIEPGKELNGSMHNA